MIGLSVSLELAGVNFPSRSLHQDFLPTDFIA